MLKFPLTRERKLGFSAHLLPDTPGFYSTFGVCGASMSEALLDVLMGETWLTTQICS